MPDVAVRRADPDELGRIIDLATTALGWDPEAPNEDFFRWKHLENPFGTSPLWVAEVDGTLAGFRTFLRWRFIRADGSTRSACRAVDTATAVEHRGRGVFTTLTRAAVEELTDEGVDFVFNTPNDQSRPGYLKMGWVDAGRIDIGVRPRLRGLGRLLGARAAADKWGLSSDVGATIDELLDGLSDATVVGPPQSDHLQTERTAGFLRWRYGFDPLHYRALTATRDPRSGLVSFRLRRRAGAVEATICDMTPTPDGGRRALLGGLRQGLRRSARRGPRHDYAIATRATAGVVDGFLPVPGFGPRLTLRDLASTAPHPDDLLLSLGDVELF